MAPGGQCGGQGEIRSPGKVAVEGDAGPPDWQNNSDGLGSSCPVLGSSLQAAFRRPTLLGGECAQPGIGVVGSWIKGPPEDAIRAGGIVGAFWRRTVAEDREGTSIVSHRFDNANQKTTSEQRSKRSSQEEVESRSRRTFKIARRPFNLLDKRKRKRKSKRANLLFLEQWKSTLWWIASWLHLPRQGGSSSQVFEMWLTRPPFEGLQSRVNQWTRTHPAGGGSPSPSDFGAHGDGRQGGDRKRRREGEDRGDDEQQRGDPREKALDEAKIPDLEEYMRERTFVFLHHFSGPEDRLSMAIQREAARRGVKVKTISTDRLQGGDLLAPQPFGEHLDMAKQGQIDGYHAGWPCSTFSRLRWRSAPNLPGPVRARWAPNGFASNSRAQQKECDDGTVMLARSLCMAQEVNLSREKGAASPFYTLENPPPSDHWEHISTWEMDETLRFIEAHHPLVVDFNTCYYEVDTEIGKRHFKPQRFVGSLRGLGSLRGVCHCGEAGHEAVVGSARSKASAAYPWQLAEDYAKLAVAHFVDIGKAEFLKMKVKIMEDHLEVMRARSRALGIHPVERPPTVDDQPAPFPVKAELDDHMVHDWRGGEGKHETLKSSVAKDKEASKMVYLGGVRHPARVVRSMASAQTLGVRIGGAWDFMIGKHPEILEMAGRGVEEHPQGDRRCTRRASNRAQGEVRVPVHPRC